MRAETNRIKELKESFGKFCDGEVSRLEKGLARVPSMDEKYDTSLNTICGLEAQCLKQEKTLDIVGGSGTKNNICFKHG